MIYLEFLEIEILGTKIYLKIRDVVRQIFIHNFFHLYDLFKVKLI